MARREFVSNYGENLKRILQEKGISQCKLSDLTDIDQPRISDYVTGKSIPSFCMAVIIAKALDCSLDEFVD